MAVDRDETLKKADKLLKEGRVAAAIEEYVRLVEDKPSDWNAVNALGDLYAKAGETERAAEQFTRAADHLYGEGFYPRASAVYKKVLKVRSNDDRALWQLADIAGRNGLSLDARSHYNRLIQDRRTAGNEQGAVDCVIRIGQLQDAGVDAKRAAASALVDRGQSTQAARMVLGVADLLTKEGRLPEAFEALSEAARLDPQDQEIRDKLEAAAPVEEVAAPVAVPEPAVEPAPVVTEIPAQPGLLAEEALPLESFFEELRGKVAHDQEVRARERFEQGLQLAEGNRPDEAISSLEEASRTPSLRFEAASHLARIYLGRDQLSVAAEWMELALEAPAPTSDDRIALMYDLADALARQGEGARAMALFMEVESESTGYRDVSDRIAHLTQAEIGKP